MLLLGITGHHIPCFRLLVVVSCTIAFHPRERHEINSRGANGGDEERRTGSWGVFVRGNATPRGQSTTRD
jgi:hypothetical protein